jgi:hypothetical protein
MNRKDSVKVHVAAFGKHPGWDDHIEEIGLDSELLVNAKRVLYTECLGGNIDSGVWEKIDDDKRLPFKHVFYWKTTDGLLVGRMWASRDGKGRTKYPMVVCAHIEGVPSGWAMAEVLPRLAQVEEKCSQTSSAELVRLAIGEARRSLEDAGMTLVGGAPAEDTTEALVARLVNHPSNSGEGRVGLVRVLYEVQREMADFRPAAPGARSRTRMGEPAAQHLRVPRTLDGPGEAARAWMAVLDQELAPSAQVLIIEPEGQRFLDIIVGDPKAGQFRCVRSGEQALGLTSDVPYTMDDTTRQEAESKIESWGKGEAKASSAGGNGNGAGSGSGNRLKLIIAGAAILLLAIIIAFAMKGGGSKGKDGGSQAPKPATADQTAENAPKPEGPKTETPKPAPAASNGGKTAAPKPEAADPRTTWGFDQALERSRAKLAHLNDELKAEGTAANTADGQKLDDLAQRAKIVAATPWKTSNVDSISHELASIDTQLADTDKDIDQGLAGVSTRVAASLQQRASSAPFQTDAMKRAWAGAVTSIDPKLGWAGSKAKADALQGAMQGAESAIGTSPATEPPPGSMIDAGTLRAAVLTKRDEALQAAANGAAAGDSARVQQAISQLKAWVDQANEVVGAAAQIESLMSAGKEGDAAKIADLAAKAQASPAYREIGPAVLPVLKQADAMRGLAGQSSPDALIEVIKGAAMDPGRRAAEAVAAWSRLPQVGWPAKAEDLAQARDLRGGTLGNAVSQVSDAATKSRLEGQVAATAKAMWVGFVERAGTSDSALAAAEGARGSFGITDADTEKLPGWARYNLMRRALGQAVAAGGKDARRAAVETFLHGVEALGAPVTSQPQVASLVAQLKTQIDKGADLDLSKLGPGGSGWKAGAVSEDGSTVTYSWERAGTTHTMQFQRLAAADDTVTFMGTTEVSVGLFIDAVTAAGKWDDLKPLLANYPAGGDDPRRGPRVWEWSVKPGQVMSVAAPGPGDTSHGWLRTKSTMSGQEYYPEGLTVPPPSPQHPMQYVSPTAAVMAARLMGCRLPTSAEWKAANSSAGGGTPNLRDQTWRREYDRAKELAANGPEYPAGGAFWPADAQKVQPMQDGTPAVEADDGALWFSPVGSGTPGFQNLVGNVAEFVWDDPASIESVEASVAKVRAALGKGEKLHVIGGSALSPKEETPTEPQSVNFAQTREGYSDVGFRLAFSAPKGASGGGSARLEQALGASGYLAPPK